MPRFRELSYGRGGLRTTPLDLLLHLQRFSPQQCPRGLNMSGTVAHPHHHLAVVLCLRRALHGSAGGLRRQIRDVQVRVTRVPGVVEGTGNRFIRIEWREVDALSFKCATRVEIVQ